MFNNYSDPIEPARKRIERREKIEKLADELIKKLEEEIEEEYGFEAEQKEILRNMELP